MQKLFVAGKELLPMMPWIFEGKRYNDLKRCGKLAEAALAAGRISALSEVGDAAYWWPIPTDEFNYNMALDQTKDQNPGY